MKLTRKRFRLADITADTIMKTINTLSTDIKSFIMLQK